MSSSSYDWMKVRLSADGLISRRRFLRAAAAGGMSAAALGWLQNLRLHAEQLRRESRSCILLWMAGGPSQFETFDPKPLSPMQGPTRAVSTSTAGLAIAEHWPRVAQISHEFGIIRSMTSSEGNHGRATYLLHTGYAPSGGIVHPGIGSVVASELTAKDSELPGFVSIQGESVGSSFLGVRYSPFIVLDPTRPPDNLLSPVSTGRLGRRLELLKELEIPFGRSGAATLVKDHQTLYTQTSQMVRSPRLRAFDLSQESDKLRECYGRTAFGQGCLLARRLIEAGITFVEVQSSGWDTHGNELASIKKLAPPVDQGMAALIQDLKARGLLERTLVIWMGEFGRTPNINLTAGRDHYPDAFNVALAGSGIKGGRVIGATDKLGTEVIDRPVSVNDLFCTFCNALGIDARKENQTNVGRPLKIVDGGKAVQELF